MCSAVQPCWSFAAMSAPCAANSVAPGTELNRAATCSAVQPVSTLACTSAPKSISTRSARVALDQVAKCSGRSPSRSPGAKAEAVAAQHFQGQPVQLLAVGRPAARLRWPLAPAGCEPSLAGSTPPRSASRSSRFRPCGRATAAGPWSASSGLRRGGKRIFMAVSQEVRCGTGKLRLASVPKM